jgi:hypothetical protein
VRILSEIKHEKIIEIKGKRIEIKNLQQLKEINRKG